MSFLKSNASANDQALSKEEANILEVYPEAQ